MNNVHYVLREMEDEKMNTVITSKEDILQKSQELVMERGVSAINMRAVAKACGVAVGSIYRYFPSKTALLQCIIEKVWGDIFQKPFVTEEAYIFKAYVRWLYESILEGNQKYSGFLKLHAICFADETQKQEGKQAMYAYWGHLQSNMKAILEQDTMVCEKAFDQNMTKEQFVDMVFLLLLSMVQQGKKDCYVLLEMVSRCIYQ